MSSTTNPVASTNGNNADAATKKRVAIVGSGVAGLAAAWALNEYSPHDVVLYEAADYVGGHTHTVTFKKGDKETPVDSGFIVANTATYPNFLAFLKHQGIQLNETEMSFSVSRDAGAFEWSGSGLSALFAQSANIVNKDIYRMVYDVLRFNQYSTDILSATRGRQDQQLTIGQYLDKYGYSESFKNNYLIPMTAAIWSTSPDKVSLDFPALTLIRFMYNHHLLQLINRPAWLTVKNGAVTYIKSITDKMPLGSVRVNSPIREVYRANRKVYVKFHDKEEVYDHIIFACHADATLKILGDQATAEEKRILGDFKFNDNVAILHSDLRLMPIRRAAWTAWNYITKSEKASDEKQASKMNTDSVCLTYYMNRLQHIDEEIFGQVLVTLNPLFRPKEETIQGEYAYTHPAFTPQAVEAQNQLPQIQNHKDLCTSYAGAWTKYGFHEDGFSSGLACAVDHLGAKIPFDFVDATFMRGEQRSVGWSDLVARGVFGVLGLARQAYHLVL